MLHILSPIHTHLQCHTNAMTINHLEFQIPILTPVHVIFQRLLSGDMKALDIQIYSSVCTLDDGLKLDSLSLFSLFFLIFVNKMKQRRLIRYT